MTRHQYLLDRYEDAYFALLMYELIISRRHQRDKICKHYTPKRNEAGKIQIHRLIVVHPSGMQQ